MQQPTTSPNDQVVANAQAGQALAKAYHAPSFTRSGKVEQLTGATTQVTTINKNGRAS